MESPNDEDAPSLGFVSDSFSFVPSDYDDAASADSFGFYDFDAINDEEFGIPPPNVDSSSISLDDVLFSEEWYEDGESALHLDNVQNEAPTSVPTPSSNADQTPSTAGSLLKCVFLQGISQQIITALEKIDSGVGCAVAAFGDKIAIGTSHGLVMAFCSQALRWCCQQNRDQAAVTSLDYNEDGTRLLAGFARGVVCMYETIEGVVLRRVEACGGGPWGVLKVSWINPATGAGSSAVVADTGGSVWLLRFTRTLGKRGTKISCLFSGARGEVCAMEPLLETSDNWNGVLAFATLYRVVVVWGVGGVSGTRPRAACQAPLVGPSDCLPLLAWQPVAADAAENSKRSRGSVVLCSARGLCIQFHQVRWGSSGPKMTHLKGPKAFPRKLTAIRWLGARRLAVLDARETLHLWETGANAVVDVLDLSNSQLVYANAHFKGVATGGKVSVALSKAGAGALVGSVINDSVTGALLLLGRTGLTRITARTTLAAAHHHADMGRWVQALETVLCRYKSLEGSSALQTCLTQRSKSLFSRLAENPIQLTDQATALTTIDVCVQMHLLDFLWGNLWDSVSVSKCEETLIVLACKRASEGLLPFISPAACQRLVNYMIHHDPQGLQKALLHIPLKCMDLHQVLSECKRLELWSAWVRVTAGTTPDDPALPLRELLPLLGPKCRENNHSCPGDVLLLYTADCFAGRLFPTGTVSISERPHIGQEVLRCLLYDPVDESESTVIRLPHLRALLLHDTGSTLRMLEMSFSVGPFVGPLGKQKRLSMALALHNVLQTSLEQNEFTEEEVSEIVSFTCNRLSNGSLPADVTLINRLKSQLSKIYSSKKAKKLIESSWLTLLSCSQNVTNHLPYNEMLELAQATNCLKVQRFLKEKIEDFDGILETFLNDADCEKEMFAYLEKYAVKEERAIAKQVINAGKKLVAQWPKHTAQFLFNHFPELIPSVLSMFGDEECALEFIEVLYKQDALDADLSIKFLKLLCTLKPDSVLEFLEEPPSALLPDAALQMIRKYNIEKAEPRCLEAAGDLSNAVKAAIRLMENAENKDERQRLAGDAFVLCTRAAKLSGPTEAESFWRYLIESISNLPEPLSSPLPALLLEGASNYLQLPWLVGKLCSRGGNTGSLRGALISLLSAARDNAEAMSAASRLTGSELHKALATALRAKRALSIFSTVCGYCHHSLHSRSMVRAYCCGHAFHVDCDPVSGQCGSCGQSATEVRLVRSSVQAGPTVQEPPQQFPLWIVAPPRPDLEGII